MNGLFKVKLIYVIFILTLSSISFLSFSETIYLPGSLKGDFQVTNSGAATYNIPIEVSPGTAGMQPAISISYSSQSSQTSLGRGWSLSGLSSISRGGRNLLDDGVVSGVTFTDLDSLFLDGQKLIPVKSISPNKTEYRTSINNYSKIVATNNGIGAESFIVNTKAGLTMEYGKSSSKVLLGNDQVLIWLCNRILDSFGNYIDFEYSFNGFGSYEVSEIKYTGNINTGLETYASVKFEYADLSDNFAPEEKYLLGYQIKSDKRLVSIESKFGDSIYRKYAIKHKKGYSKTEFLLKEIEVSGQTGQTYKPTKFKYFSGGTDTGDSIWEEVKNTDGIPLFSQYNFNSKAYLIEDFNGDNYPDLLYGEVVSGELVSKYFEGSSSSWKELSGQDYKIPFPLADSNEPINVSLLNINNDATPEILVSGAKNYENGIYEIKGKRWALNGGLSKLPDIKKNIGNISPIFIDINNDNLSDILIPDESIENNFNAYLQNSYEWVRSDNFDIEKVEKLELIDINVDSIGDLLTVNYSDSNKVFDIGVLLAKRDGWERETKEKFNLSFTGFNRDEISYHLVNINDDEFLDLIVSTNKNDVKKSNFYLAGRDGWEKQELLGSTLNGVNLFNQSNIIFSHINNDGLIDIIFHDQDFGEVVLIQDVEIDAGIKTHKWINNFNNLSPLPLTHNLADTYKKSIDLDNDGLDELVFFYNHDGSFAPKVYKVFNDSWQLASDRQPPVKISKFDKASLGTQFIDLNGDGLQDVVTNDKSYRNTGNGWQGFNDSNGDKCESCFKPPISIISENGGDTGIRIIDISGNGLVDFIYAIKKKDGMVSRGVYLNTGHSWENQSSLAKSYTAALNNNNVLLTHQGSGTMGTQLIDLNGDGRVDILSSRRESFTESKRFALLNNGSTWQSRQEYIPCDLNMNICVDLSVFSEDLVNHNQHISSNNQIKFKNHSTGSQILDLNGDSLPDILFSYRVANTKWTSEEIVDAKELWNKENPFDPLPEGLNQAVVGGINNYHKQNLKGALINSGQGWVYKSQFYDGIAYRLDGELEKILGTINAKNNVLTVYPIDHNNDGLIDLHFAERRWLKTGFKKAYITYTNTGNGFTLTKDDQWNILKIDNSLIPDESINVGDFGFRFLDLNGDSKLDIAQKILTEDGSTLYEGAWLNDGTTWVKNKKYTPKVGFARIKRGDIGVRLTDLNGDGLPDYVKSTVESKNGKDEHVQSAWLNKSNGLPILNSIEDGLFNLININYESMSLAVDGASKIYQQPNLSQRSVYPIIDALPPAYLVKNSQLISPGYDLAQVNYQYGGFRINALSGQSMGFEWFKQLNLSTDTYNYIKYHQTCTLEDVAQCYLNGRSFLHKSGVISEGQNLLLKKANSTWNISKSTNHKNFNVVLSEKIENKFDEFGNKTGKKEQSFIYDLEQTEKESSGNVVQSKVVINDHLQTVTHNKYEDRLDKWFLGRLTESKVTITDINSKQSENKSACFTYSKEEGVLTSEVSNCGHEKQVTTQYIRDKFGNAISTTVSAKDVESRSTQVNFVRSNGRFPVEVTNELGHTNKVVEYDPVTGSVITQEDSNGLLSHSYVNDFGQLIKSIDSSGLLTTIDSRVHSTSCKSHLDKKCYSVKTKVGDLPEITSFYDSASREIKTTGTGFAGKPIVQEYQYNSIGQLKQSSIPHFTQLSLESNSTIFNDTQDLGEANCSESYSNGGLAEQLSKKQYQSYWSKNYFDSLGRPTLNISTNGAVTCKEYSYRKTTEYDALGNYSITFFDDFLRPTKIVDALKNETNFQYDFNGRLVKTVNANGENIVHKYNELGEKTDTVDPDLGHWKYEYNSLGLLKKQVDAKNQITLLHYDVLGRLIKKIEADKTSRWHYDGSTHGIGKLSWAGDDKGYLERYFYDRLARPIKTITTANGESFTTKGDYDPYSRLQSSTSPTGYKVVNYYDDTGFLIKVEGENDNEKRVHWQAIKYDAVGRVLEEKLGNGVVSSNKYNEFSGHLSHITSKKSNQEILQNNSYNYDLTGNITESEDSVNKLKQANVFDSLGRLVSISDRTNFKSKSYKYDNVGNFIQKSDFGHYKYDDNSSNRLTAVTTTTGKELLFEYDGSGNITNSYKGRFSYFADNLVKSIVNNDKSYSSFKYTPSGQRYFQDYVDQRRHIKTTYIGSYEKIKEIGVEPLLPTSERIRHRHYISGANGLIGVYEEVDWLFPVRHSRSFEKISGFKKPEHTVKSTTQENYFIKDNIGSIVGVLDSTSNVLEKFFYDPWGKRLRQEERQYNTIRLGFTGHEHLDNLDLIHMNGRVYDPDVGRFVSADPLMQSPGFSQNYSRYSYVFNNPYKYTDPSGYWGINIGSVFKGIGSAIGGFFGGLGSALGGLFNDALKAINKVGKWFEKNWREVVTVVVVVAVTVVTAGAGTPAVLAGMAAGFAGGATSAALYGGSFSDILNAGFRGAVIGGISAGLAQAWGGVGGMADGMGLAEGSVGRAVGHGVGGGITSEMQGGEFMQGFGSSAFTHYASAQINVDGIEGFEGEQFARVSADAAIGGTASVLGGGNFVNGAMSASFQRMFNAEPHRTSRQKLERWLANNELPQGVVDGFAGFGDALLLGAGPKLREWTGANSYVNVNSSEYSYGSMASIAVGGARLAYASIVKGYSIIARSGAAASAFRNSAKTFFRGNIGKTWRPANINRYTTDAALRAASGRTNPYANAYGTGVIYSGVKSK